MANYFDTGIQLTAGFSLSGQAPLDGRTVVENLSDLDNHVAENRCYEGMEVYVLEDKKKYIYNGTTFEEFVSGGNGNVDLTEINNELAQLANKTNSSILRFPYWNNDTDTYLKIPSPTTFSRQSPFISITSSHGGCIVLLAGDSSEMISYSLTKCIRLSHDNLWSHDATVAGTEKIANVYVDKSNGYCYVKLVASGSVSILGINEAPVGVETLPADVTEVPISDLTQQTDLTAINTKIAQLETQSNDLFQSVSDGKTLVANAITDKGVPTSSTDTFATMASNIGNINIATVGYTSEKKSGSVRVDEGETGTISITFSNTVLGVTSVDFDWTDTYEDFRGFSVSGNTVTVEVNLSSTYGSYTTIYVNVTANILA